MLSAAYLWTGGWWRCLLGVLCWVEDMETTDMPLPPVNTASVDITSDSNGHRQARWAARNSHQDSLDLTHWPPGCVTVILKVYCLTEVALSRAVKLLSDERH